MSLNLEDPRLLVAAEAAGLQPKAVRYVYAAVAGAAVSAEAQPFVPSRLTVLQVLAAAAVYGYGLLAPAVLREEGLDTAAAVGRHVVALVQAGVVRGGAYYTADAYDPPYVDVWFQTFLKIEANRHLASLRPAGWVEELCR